MFDTYTNIFDKRGAAYHEAMTRYPDARDLEFAAMLELLEPADDELLVDMPSGGGYLRRYLNNQDVRLVALETSPAFYEQCVEDEQTERRLCDLTDTGLESGSVDAVVSMAGLHHVDDKLAVFNEVHRILRPGGRFCVADVEEGSPIDGFLNDFVDTHNSMGHDGDFVNGDFREALKRSTLSVDVDEIISYSWKFDSVEEMVTYCTLMFGLDRATPDEVLDGIAAYQGYSFNSTCHMNWHLRFIRAWKKAE